MNKYIIQFKALIFLFLFILEVKHVKANPAGFHIKKGHSKAIIPFKKINGFMVIPLQINDGDQLNFLLDTGIRSLLLFDKKYAKKAGLEFKRKISIYGVGKNHKIKAYVSDNAIISLPYIQGLGISVVSLEKRFYQMTKIKIHGAIGYQLFSRFVVAIDNKNQEIILHEEKDFIPDPSYHTIPMNVDLTKPILSLDIFYERDTLKSVRLMIDTGFNNDLILLTNTKTKNFLAPIKHFKRDHIGTGLAGIIRGQTIHSLNILICNITINQVNGLVPVNYTYGKQAEVMKRDGIIGNKLLDQFNFIFDYINSIFYLKPKNVPDSNKEQITISSLLKPDNSSETNTN